MMNRAEILKNIIEHGIVAIIRTDKDEHVPSIAEALFRGGVTTIEVTMNTPNALKWIKSLSGQSYDGLSVGAGTVLNREMATACIQAGAQFLVTPFTKQEIIKEAHARNIPVLSGAMTPGEIADAHEMGADIVKVFPAEFFGPKYIRAIKAPLDFIKLMPTGGVSQKNVVEWITAGADALGVGSALFTSQMLEERKYDLITENAKALMEAVKQARQ